MLVVAAHHVEEPRGVVADLAAQHPGQSGYSLIRRGRQAFTARVAAADLAQKTLDVQYFLWEPDATGRLLSEHLLRAADRGVRVRILVDDVGTKANDETLLTLDAHPNIEIRLFNPVANRSFRGLGLLADFSRTNRRMHNKAFVADNQRAVVGGRNIGDEYFEASGDVAFGDLDPELAQQTSQKLGVGQARHIGQQQRLIGQDRGGHQLEGGVLGAADRNASVQTGAAGDGDAVHIVSCGPEQGARGSVL
jgi:putative cardiolipin synthase